MFEIVNEVAIVGTTFFMLAVYTLWYSPFGFGRLLGTDGSLQENTYWEKKVIMQLLITACLFFSALLILAYAVALTSILSLDLIVFSIVASIFTAVFVAVPAIMESRSRMYLTVHIGFVAFFIIGGTYLISNWPW